MKPDFSLEVEGAPPKSNPTGDGIEGALRLIHPRGPSFFILSDRGGSYVQAAGARLKLTVEWRKQSAAGFAHYVLGRKESSSRAQEVIGGTAGPITVFLHEVLDVEEAVSIFRGFFLKGRPPEAFALRDDTARFAEILGEWQVIVPPMPASEAEKSLEEWKRTQENRGWTVRLDDVRRDHLCSGGDQPALIRFVVRRDTP